jgi:glutathione S-transferase
MQLFGDSRSGNCYKVAWLLNILDIPFEWCETDILRGETRTEEYLGRNINGKVPLLRLADGRYLAESNAILLYLADGSPWLPKDHYQRGLVYQWLFFEQYSHEPYIAVARFLVHLAGKAVEKSARLEHLHERGYVALGIMEHELSGKNWIAGDAFTIADIALYAYTHTAPDGLFSLDGFPAVLRWLARIEDRDDYVTMIAACR